MRKKVLNIAHRGASDDFVENSAPSFAAALAHGADILETDLRLSEDGHLVLAHDEDFSRLARETSPIAELTRSEIKKLTIDTRHSQSKLSPLFMDEALSLFPTALFNVDLKDRGPAIVDSWIALLKKNDAVERCRTASFDDSTLRLFHRRMPTAPISVAAHSFIRFFIRTLCNYPRRPLPCEGVLQLPEKIGHVRLITPRRINLWHRYGWKVQVWTVDDIQDMKRLIEWEVDGIMTNRPAQLTTILQNNEK